MRNRPSVMRLLYSNMAIVHGALRRARPTTPIRQFPDSDDSPNGGWTRGARKGAQFGTHSAQFSTTRPPSNHCEPSIPMTRARVAPLPNLRRIPACIGRQATGALLDAFA